MQNDGMQTIIDEESDTVSYVGRAPRGALTSEAKWDISKIEISGDITTIKEDDSVYGSIWDNRTSLTYK